MRPQTFPDTSIPRDAHRMTLHELPGWTTLIDFAANLTQLATFFVALRAFFFARRIRNRHQRTRQLARPPTFRIFQGRSLTLGRRCRANLRRWVPTVLHRQLSTDLSNTLQVGTNRPCPVRYTWLMSRPTADGRARAPTGNPLFCCQVGDHPSCTHGLQGHRAARVFGLRAREITGELGSESRSIINGHKTAIVTEHEVALAGDPVVHATGGLVDPLHGDLFPGRGFRATSVGDQVIVISEPSADATRRVRTDRSTPARRHSLATRNNIPRYGDAR
jgi:hypothetical protein